MMAVVQCRTEEVSAKRSLKEEEVRYIFHCLKHIFWDAGFQAQVYLKQNQTNANLANLRQQGLFSNTCILTLKMKKCLQNYPGLVDIISKYIGKKRWHCTNDCCSYKSNYSAFWGIRSIALREESRDPTKGCMIHYCMYVYLRTMYNDIAAECERIYKEVKGHLIKIHPCRFHFLEIYDLQR